MALVVLSSFACGQDSAAPRGTTDPPINVALTDLLTAAAAADLTPEGIFQLASPDAVALPIITADRAGELALAFTNKFGGLFQSTWSSQAGRSIRIRDLSVASRVLFSESPYRRINQSVHAGVRKFLGPYYIVTLLQDGEPILSVAVSAYNTDMGIEDGRLDLPTEYGNDFFVEGLPHGTTSRPIMPEEAVRIAAATGAKVRAAPVLIAPAEGYSPQQARWKVELDRPVVLELVPQSDERNDTLRVEVHEVFVGLGGSLEVAQPNQPPFVELQQPRSLKSDPGVVRVWSKRPTRFHAVTPSRR